MPIIKDPPEYVAKRGQGKRFVVIFYDPKNLKAGFYVGIFDEDVANPNGGGDEIVACFKENHPRLGMEVAAWVHTSWFENIEEGAYEIGIRELKKKIFGNNIRRHGKGSCDSDDLYRELNSHRALRNELAARKRLEESPLLQDIKSRLTLMTKA